MPCAAAACSAWFLICSTSRSVMRLMSPVSAPPNPREPAERRGPASGSGSGSALGSPADRDADVAAVEAHLDHAVPQRGGDLGGQVGERVHDRQPGGRLDGGAEQRGGAPRLLVAGSGRGGEVLAQLRARTDSDP